MKTSNTVTVLPTLSTTSSLQQVLRAQELELYVAQCHEEAIRGADRRAWANSRFEHFTQVVGELVPQDALRLVQFTAGERTGVKEQSFTNAAFVATMVPTLVAGYTSTQLMERQLAEAFPEWTPEQASKWASKLLVKFARAGLVESTTDQHGRVGPKVTFEGDARLPRVFLSEMAQADFEEWAYENSGIKLMPLNVQPMDWLNVHEGVAEGLGLRLIPKALKGVKVGAAALRGINAMQRVAFIVNQDIQGLAQEYLDNLHSLEFKSVGAKEHDERLCRRILSMNAGERYWLPMTCDTRGRMYYRGGQLTPQGKDLAKAAFCFADARRLGEDGLDVLWLMLANTWGLKGSMQDRVQSAMAMWSQVQNHEWFDVLEVADEPFQAYAVICELRRVMALDESVREAYPSRLVCHMDGSQNGYQHQAAIIGDRQTAMNTNLLEATYTDTPFDAYMAVLDAILASKAPERVKALARKLGRKLVKQPTMTTQYNATVRTFAQHMALNFAAEFEAADVKYYEMARAAADAVDTVLPAARTLIRVYADRFSTEITNEFGEKERIYTGPEVIRWTLPDGFEVAMSYRSNEWRTVRAAQSAVVMPLADGEKDPIDGGKMLRALAANFIQSLDACHMRMIAAASAHPVVGIHDSVGCHAANFFEVAELVRETFVELHSNDVLNQMLAENDRTPCRFIRRTYDVSESINAVYMFS